MKKVFKRFVKSIVEFGETAKDDHTGAFAAQAAFFILLAFFPMISITLTLIKFLPVSEEQVISFLEDILSTEKSGLISSMVNEIFTSSTSSVTIVSIVVGLWSAARGILAIRDGINVIYKSGKIRNYFLKRLISTLYTLVIIVLIIALTLVSVFGNQIVNVITKRFPAAKPIATNILSLRGAFIFVAMFVILCLMYKIMPERRVRLKYQIAGALFASVFFGVMNNLFNLYISKVVMKSYAYGSLTMGVILMFWLYFGVTAILIGGQINVYLERTDLLRTVIKNDGSEPLLLPIAEPEPKTRKRKIKKQVEESFSDNEKKADEAEARTEDEKNNSLNDVSDKTE
jgi:membrane protein